MSARCGDGTLAQGDRVGIVAPGFAVRASALNRGLARIRALGFLPVVGEHVRARAGYLAGRDDQRLDDLVGMMTRRDIRGIWFARGGYGVSRLIDRIPARAWSRPPGVFVGYSDLTALFAVAAARRPEIRCLYGPVVSELGDPGAYHLPTLRRALAGDPIELRATPSRVLVPGAARGPLAGGNLSLLAHLCGTRHFPVLAGRVLFLEEVGEEVYRIDRMLTQLRMAGAFRGISGVLLGAFSPVPRRRFPGDRRLADVFRENFGGLGVPVIRGIPAGHRAGKRTLPLGATVEVDTTAGRVRFYS